MLNRTANIMWFLHQNIKERLSFKKSAKISEILLELCAGILCRYRGKNTAAIKSYIGNQLKHDQECDQLSLFDPETCLRVANNQCVAGGPINNALVGWIVI